MLNARFRPLENWPGKRIDSWNRKEATFRVTYDKTLDLLEYELGKLRAKEVVIQVDNLSLNDIRNDGWPRSSWHPRGGNVGVIVSFESPKGPLSFPCDRYNEWQDNLRAIALSLEALRTVDRYGVTRGNEQYRGWQRLEAPAAKMTRESAIDFLRSIGANINGQPLSSESLSYICRSMMAKYHPDSVTDEAEKKRRHEIFVKIGQAQEVLAQ